MKGFTTHCILRKQAITKQCTSVLFCSYHKTTYSDVNIRNVYSPKTTLLLGAYKRMYQRAILFLALEKLYFKISKIAHSQMDDLFLYHCTSYSNFFTLILFIDQPMVRCYNVTHV